MKPLFVVLLLLVVPRSQGDEIVNRKLKLNVDSELHYSLYLPESLGSGEARPLILALHYGWGGGDERAPKFTGMQYMEALVLPAFEELNAVIAAPDCPATSWNDERSEDALLALLDYLIDEHNIDTERIVITGFSLGGAGTWMMAARHPDRFSAAIPVAGFPMTEVAEDPAEYRKQMLAVIENPLEACTLPTIPVYAIHGQRDEVVPYEQTMRSYRILKEAGMNLECVTAENLSHYQTAGYVEWLSASIPWLKKQWTGRER